MGVLYDAAMRREAQQKAAASKKRTHTETIHILCIDEMSPWTEEQATAMLKKLSDKRSERT